MGLDSWVYKVRKMTGDEKGEVVGKSRMDAPDWAVCVPEDEMDGCMLGDWDGLYDIVIMKEDELDSDRMERDLGVPEGYVRVSTASAGDVVRMRFYPEDGPFDEKMLYEVSISFEDMERYLSWRYVKCAVFHRGPEIKYWRKNWDMQELVGGYVRIENCGFHILTDECLYAMMDASEEPDGNGDVWKDDVFEPPMCRPNERLCYHPWW